MRPEAFVAAALALLLAGLVRADAREHAAHFVDESVTVDPPLLFEPPAPGSYELPPILRVEDYMLVAEDGGPAPLPGLGSAQVGVVSFIYRGCVDASGCPLALAVLRRLDRELAERPELAAQVRLATVSFDPEHDTPERMSELRELMQPRGDWRFLTAASEQAMRPVMRDFGQDAVRLATPKGEPSALLRHVLKVFLLDGTGAVRNIYSAGFLDWRMLLNDIQTVRATR